MSADETKLAILTAFLALVSTLAFMLTGELELGLVALFLALACGLSSLIAWGRQR